MGKYKLVETDLTEKDLESNTGRIVLRTILIIVLIVALALIGICTYLYIVPKESEEQQHNVVIDNTTEVSVEYERTEDSITINLSSKKSCYIAMSIYEVVDNTNRFRFRCEVEFTPEVDTHSSTYKYNPDLDYKIVIKEVKKVKSLN